MEDSIREEDVISKSWITNYNFRVKKNPPIGEIGGFVIYCVREEEALIKINF